MRENRIAEVITNTRDAAFLHAVTSQSGRFEGRATLQDHIRQLLTLDSMIGRHFPQFAAVVDMPLVKQVHIAHDLPEGPSRPKIVDGMVAKKIIRSDVSHSEPQYANLRAISYRNEQRRWSRQRLHYSEETRAMLDNGIDIYEKRHETGSITGHAAKAIDMGSDLLYGTRGGTSGYGAMFDALRSHYLALPHERFVEGPLRQHMIKTITKFLEQSQVLQQHIHDMPEGTHGATDIQLAKEQQRILTTIVLDYLNSYCNGAFADDISQLTQEFHITYGVDRSQRIAS